MLTTATTELIHRVLDGEASPAEAQQLQRTLAAEPAARAEYKAAQQLFADFQGVAQRHPPEGLVAAVMGAVEAPAAKSRRSNQLLSLSRVFGSAPRDSVSRTSQRSKPFTWSQDMSKQNSSPFGNRKFWIGGATAAAALVVWQFGFSQWPLEKDVMGTIAPAERYRAPQPGAGDIKVDAAPASATAQADVKPPIEVTQKAATQANNAERVTADRATAERVNADRATAERVNAERATVERVTAERATVERVNADRATAERVNADRATMDRAVQQSADKAANKAAAAAQPK